MATMVNGTNMVLSVDDTSSAEIGQVVAIAGATSCTINITTDSPEVTDKTSGDRKEYIGLSTSWTMDAEVFYNEDGGVNLSTLFIPAYGAGTTAGTGADAPTQDNYPRQVWVKFLGNTGGDYYHGAGFITSLSATGGTEDGATYSVSIQGTGSLTKLPA